MADLQRIRCQGCGGEIEYYEGQGLFKCGSCGSIYESLGGTGGVSVIQLTQGAAVKAQQPTPEISTTPGGWQPPMSSGSAYPGFQQPMSGYQPGLGYQGPQEEYQKLAHEYQRAAAQQLRAPGSGKIAEFFTFRRFITPVIIQIIFWLGVLICIGGGIAIMSAGGGGDYYYGGGGVEWNVLAGLLVILIGPILVRIWCELQILLFRIFDELKQINYNSWYMNFNTSKLVEVGGETKSERT